eukprot:SAG31_NODE_1459_length_8254_cov_4.297854_9_plen_314_part_00
MIVSALATSVVAAAAAAGATADASSEPEASDSGSDFVVAAAVHKIMRQPFEYAGFSSFPASFFGANPVGVENRTEMALVARHQLAGWGWQAGCSDECGVHCDHKGGCPKLPPPGYGPASGHANEESASYTQAKTFHAFIDELGSNHSTQGIFVYRQMCNAVWWYERFYDALMDTSKRGFFLTSERTGELCWDAGGFLDFRNSSAINWYVETVVGELLNESDAVGFIFFDGAPACGITTVGLWKQNVTGVQPARDPRPQVLRDVWLLIRTRLLLDSSVRKGTARLSEAISTSRTPNELRRSKGQLNLCAGQPRS